MYNTTPTLGEIEMQDSDVDVKQQVLPLQRKLDDILAGIHLLQKSVNTLNNDDSFIMSDATSTAYSLIKETYKAERIKCLGHVYLLMATGYSITILCKERISSNGECIEVTYKYNEVNVALNTASASVSNSGDRYFNPLASAVKPLAAILFSPSVIAVTVGGTGLKDF